MLRASSRACGRTRGGRFRRRAAGWTRWIDRWIEWSLFFTARSSGSTRAIAFARDATRGWDRSIGARAARVRTGVRSSSGSFVSFRSRDATFERGVRRRDESIASIADDLRAFRSAFGVGRAIASRSIDRSRRPRGRGRRGRRTRGRGAKPALGIRTCGIGLAVQDSRICAPKLGNLIARGWMDG